MKILFAVNNEKISETITKKFQQDYKEIISAKNVYYFNAIAKELQKDKNYDRIIISEDLEPFANNNFEVIDKFIFEKLDNISDEATSSDGQDIPIILICADRRAKSETFLVKIFGIGIYSALLGNDRSIDKVCELISKPRTKKEAKIYYRVDSDDVDYKVEGEGDVSEVELNNILNHYKSLGKNEEKYVESFDNIATQYTDAQLRVICKFLPLNVKAVLEGNSQKYQELITFGTVTPSVSTRQKGKKQQEQQYVPNADYVNKNKSENREILEKNIGKSNLTKPVVIPTGMNISKNQNTNAVQNFNENQNINQNMKINNENNSIFKENGTADINNEKKEEDIIEEPQKKKRGRPKKIQPEQEQKNAHEDIVEEPQKKKRGRPKKVQPEENILQENSLNVESENDDNNDAIDLFNLGNDTQTNSNKSREYSDMILPGFDEEEVQPVITNDNNEITSIEHEPVQYNNIQESNYAPNYNNVEIENRNKQYTDLNLDSLITGNKKIVAFVGTSKNGTSFIVNNLAELLSKKEINVAILDLTKNKNAYYIYTKNEEELRKKAYTSIQNLANGVAEGIKVNKNLTVFTTLPGEDTGIDNYENILRTLAQNYSLVLMDCDFDTNYGYFKNAQEIYLVQSFDILTIQPLTAFLRNLKSKNVLDSNKLRIVLNKVLNVRSVNEKTIIGGMAFYNDPAMSFMTELFDRDNIKYCSIPFEEQTYSRYLEGLVNCEIKVNGYSKNLLASLEKLSNMVYPLLTNNVSKNGLNSYNSNGFSNNMNNTLNKMKNNY